MPFYLNPFTGEPDYYQAGSSTQPVNTINGNSGTATPNTNGALNIQTANTNIKFVGSGNSLIQDFAPGSNILVGSSYSAVNGIADGNTSFGQLSLQSLTGGISNTVVGHATATTLTNGNYNSVFGEGALFACGSTVSGNVAIGWHSMIFGTCNNCVAIGYSSMANNTSATSATCVGYLSGQLITTGSNATYIGSSAGQNSLTNSDCTYIGNAAGANSQSGANNTVVGSQAYASLVSPALGSNNTHIGYQSGFNNQQGSNNISLGYQSLAGANGFSGNSNLVLGFTSGSSYTTTESSNILIGAWGSPLDNNTIRIGMQGSTSLRQNRFFAAGITGLTVASSAVVGVDGNGQLSSLGTGTAGQVMTSNGTASPTFQAPITSNTANATRASGAALALTTATNANVTSVSLAAGTWLVTGIVEFAGNPTVSGAQTVSISTTSATHTTLGDNSIQSAWLTNSFTTSNCAVYVPGYILTVASTTTVYLVASGVFSAGAMSVYGRISAVRIS